MSMENYNEFDNAQLTVAIEGRLDTTTAPQLEKFLSENSEGTQSEYIAALSALLFDAVALVSLFCVWIMRNSIVSAYISPVLSIIIAVYLFLTCDKHIRQAISELSDRTLPEEEQLKILKVLTKHDNEYSSFGSIKSRYNGTEVIIDISMSFSQSTTYSEIAALQKAMQQELSEEIENCHISIVIE